MFFCVSLDRFDCVLLVLLGLVLSVPSQEIGWEERLQNDPFCVEYRPWRRDVVVSGVRCNEVNARRARLVPGRVTVFGRVYHLGMQQAN